MVLTFKYFQNIEDISEIQDALDIRFKVFVVEQKVDKEIELDEYENTAVHIVMYDDEKPIANCRIIFVDDKIKIGRVAVLSQCRGKGYGEMIMKEALNYLIKEGKENVYISSQLYIKSFYEKLGFEVISEVYMEANIEHIAMVCNLKDKQLYHI